MKRDAALGPDGFNVAFYRAAWSWIGDDVTTLVRNFYNSGVLPSDINKTFIVLIPKRNTPVLPQDFRPISLCNVQNLWLIQLGLFYQTRFICLNPLLSLVGTSLLISS